MPFGLRARSKARCRLLRRWLLHRSSQASVCVLTGAVRLRSRRSSASTHPTKPSSAEESLHEQASTDQIAERTVLGIVLSAAGTSWAQTTPVPSTITEQGVLTDRAGLPLLGSASVRFAVYDQPSGADGPRWSETQTISLVDGYFTAHVGAVTPLPPGLFDGSVRYLGIAVNGGAELTPRRILDSAPYALEAGDVTGDIHPNSVVVGGATVINAAGQWVGSPSGLQGPAGPPGAPGAQGSAGSAERGRSTGTCWRNGVPGSLPVLPGRRGCRAPAGRRAWPGRWVRRGPHRRSPRCSPAIPTVPTWRREHRHGRRRELCLQWGAPGEQGPRRVRRAPPVLQGDQSARSWVRRTRPGPQGPPVAMQVVDATGVVRGPARSR